MGCGCGGAKKAARQVDVPLAAAAAAPERPVRRITQRQHQFVRRPRAPHVGVTKE